MAKLHFLYIVMTQIWVSPPKVAWHLFAFPIGEMTPTVYHLQLHINGHQYVSFKSNQIVDQILNNPIIKKNNNSIYYRKTSQSILFGQEHTKCDHIDDDIILLLLTNVRGPELYEDLTQLTKYVVTHLEKPQKKNAYYILIKVY
ncbi:hypothetical protein H5410_060754 [Solanum commersonii]|uniref:Uncharacterized protein n=1 Tax=Solanum commersonii TaxID=4109 RepID=A0A9J5W6Z8_SOLCO|nr:hypothetical protein H5410_060754 [Solanum commersonii]